MSSYIELQGTESCLFFPLTGDEKGDNGMYQSAEGNQISLLLLVLRTVMWNLEEHVSKMNYVFEVSLKSYLSWIFSFSQEIPPHI